MRILAAALLSTFVLLGISCGKDKDKDDSRQRRFVSVKLDNRIYLSENPKGVIHVPDFSDDETDNDYPKLEITGQTSTGDVISLSIVAPALPITPGTYPCTREGNSITMVLNSGYPATLTSQGSTDCVITINAIDNIAVEGTFTGTIKDITGAGGTKVISNGAFRAMTTQVSQ